MFLHSECRGLLPDICPAKWLSSILINVTLNFVLEVSALLQKPARGNYSNRKNLTSRQ
jgi:hypothetical protein